MQDGLSHSTVPRRNPARRQTVLSSSKILGPGELADVAIHSSHHAAFRFATMAESEVERRPPLPPFTRETALLKVKAAENAWNSRNPDVVALAYTKDSEWRNRTEFFQSREAIKQFLTTKWAHELDYRLMKELWAFTDNHIAMRFEYEWRNEAGQCFRTHGNELWEFEENGLMRRRDMSANDVPIHESERRYPLPDAQ